MSHTYRKPITEVSMNARRFLADPLTGKLDSKSVDFLRELSSDKCGKLNDNYDRSWHEMYTGRVAKKLYKKNRNRKARRESKALRNVLCEEHYEDIWQLYQEMQAMWGDMFNDEQDYMRSEREELEQFEKEHKQNLLDYDPLGYDYGWDEDSHSEYYRHRPSYEACCACGSCMEARKLILENRLEHLGIDTYDVQVDENGKLILEIPLTSPFWR